MKPKACVFQALVFYPARLKVNILQEAQICSVSRILLHRHNSYTWTETRMCKRVRMTRKDAQFMEGNRDRTSAKKGQWKRLSRFTENNDGLLLSAKGFAIRDDLLRFLKEVKRARLSSPFLCA